MLQIGKINRLRITRDSAQGFYLQGDEPEEILLPRKYVTREHDIGQEIEVFVSYDSEDRLFASTTLPFVQVGEIGSLEVVALENIGAFLDWGLPKDLLLPFSEQTRSLRIGQNVVVALYIDKSQRIAASMRVDRHLPADPPANYKEGDAVELLLVGPTDLGYKALINGKHMGILYTNEIFRPLSPGEKTKGFVKKPRADGKIDLILETVGHKAKDEIAQKILELLKSKDGFLPIDDKTSAEIIYDYFGVSKKKYKMALGGLYKQRLIRIDDDGIRLVKA